MHLISALRMDLQYWRLNGDEEGYGNRHPIYGDFGPISSLHLLMKWNLAILRVEHVFGERKWKLVPQ